MRERTTWSRARIASQLLRVAEDPRAMNQDHLSQQPAADAYVIGGPSEFAEDHSPEGSGWKADLGSDGNTKRDEIGMPVYRKDTFNNPEKSPGVSPSRQATLADVHIRAKVATRIARLILPKTASEQLIEDQAVTLMDLPLPNLRTTLNRLAQDQDADDEDDDDDDGQSKEASDDEDDDEDEGQSKQAKDLPPEFLKNIQKKKDEAKDKDDDKSQSKEARRRLRAQQDDSDDEDEGQQKQARRLKAQQQDDSEDAEEGQSKEARRRLKAQQQDDSEDDESQQKQARSRKAQQQDDSDDEDEGQQKQARRVKAQQDDSEDEETQQKQARRRLKAQQQDDSDDEDEGQQKQARRRLKAQQQDDEEKEQQVGKEAYALIKQAAASLLKMPVANRAAAFKLALPSLAKAASEQLPQLAQEQVQSQVQQLVQNAMQQQLSQGQQQQVGQQQLLGQGQQQQTLADDALVDQMLQEPGQFSEEDIQMDAPDMDLGFQGGEDQALQQIFASDSEVQHALEAKALEAGLTPKASTRTASTRTVGTRPSAGVSQLGGGAGSASGSGAEEINRLAGMWSSAPDVSGVFRS